MRTPGVKHGRSVKLPALAALFVCFLAIPLSRAQDARARVEQLLASPRGDLVEQLAALGAPAVPVLLEKLDAYGHPVPIVQALGRIGDRTATAPLLALLNRLDPFNPAENQHQEECLIVIAALGQLGDSRAEATLHSLSNGEQVRLATRLSAAAAMARWGSPAVRNEAVSLILKSARQHKPGAGEFRPEILDEALAAVASDESRTILLERLAAAPLTSEQLAIIRLLSRDAAAQIAAPFTAFSERTDRDPYVRLQAAKAVVNSGSEFSHERILRVAERLALILPPELRPEAERLVLLLR